jgi:hypothetical protein
MSQHCCTFRLAYLDRLKAPGQCRILFYILPIFRPSGRRDGSQRSSRKRRLQQIGSVARASLATRPNQCVGLVDERMIGVGDA